MSCALSAFRNNKLTCPCPGLMFWSSFADTYQSGGKIEMSNLDGTSRKVLAAKGVNGNGSIFWPVSLTYSKETKTLYWLDVLRYDLQHFQSKAYKN